MNNKEIGINFGERTGNVGIDSRYISRKIAAKVLQQFLF